MAFHKFEVKSSVCKTEVFMDGKPLDGVRYIKIEQEVGMEVPTITLQLFSDNIRIVGDFLVEGKPDA